MVVNYMTDDKYLTSGIISCVLLSSEQCYWNLISTHSHIQE